MAKVFQDLGFRKLQGLVAGFLVRSVIVAGHLEYGKAGLKHIWRTVVETLCKKSRRFEKDMPLINVELRRKIKHCNNNIQRSRHNP